MKRFFIMLLITCSAIATTNAQRVTPQMRSMIRKEVDGHLKRMKALQNQNKSTKKTQGKSAQKTTSTTASTKTTTTTKKPTNVIKVLNDVISSWGLNDANQFSVKRNPNTNLIESSERIVSFSAKENFCPEQIEKAFMKDEPLSYSFIHVAPHNTQLYSIDMVNSDNKVVPDIPVRRNYNQEMWFMCVKNTENPELRDIYAIVWEKGRESKIITGSVYMITSKRPDLYERANMAEKMRGNFDLGIIDVDSVELARKAEQARKVFEVRPDTVVIDDIVPDSIPYETIDEVHIITPPEDNSNRWNVTPLPYTPNDRQRINVKTTPQWKQEIEWRLQAKVFFIKNDIDFIKATYESISKNYQARLNISSNFEQLLKQNKELDKKYQDFIKSLNKIQNIPENERNNLQADLYKEILKFYTEQNVAFTDMNKQLGTLPKSGQKTQKYLIELTEKYMNEMTKLMSKYK